MSDLSKPSPIPKCIALVIVTVVAAWLIMRFDVSALAKLDSMAPADYMEHQRHLHQHSFIYHFVTFLVLGGFYLGFVEFLSYIVRSIILAKRDA
jgi:flagellar biosynthesis protein FlhB